MTDIERRVAADTWPDADLAIRAIESDPADELAGLRFSGYAAVFNVQSEPLPGPHGTYRETIAPTAFTKTLAEKRSPIKLFWNHNSDIVLASTGARGQVGRLELTVDQVGLRADTIILPEYRTYAASVAAGVADSMSFGFTDVTPAAQRFSEDGSQRTLRDVRLHEVSIVSGWPAYAATSASVRALAEASGLDPETLSAAIDALRASLRDPDQRLTTEQARTLVHMVNTRSDQPVIGARLAHHRETFAAKKAALA